MADQEMINRVAKAIHGVYGITISFEALLEPNKRILIAQAKAAICAMREPTEAQYNALSATNKLWRELTSYDVWTTYIDTVVNND